MHEDLIHRFHAVLPELRSWIDVLLAEHAERARAVSSLGFRRLAACFPPELLDRARVVVVPVVPFPPLDRLGLPELAQTGEISFAGITFRDTYFLREGQASESLHFHELVHVVQWERLGIDRFLLAYGAGLLEFGYAESPLEEMAYSLQKRFEIDELPLDLVRFIEAHADEVWSRVARMVQPDGADR